MLETIAAQKRNIIGIVCVLKSSELIKVVSVLRIAAVLGQGDPTTCCGGGP